MAALSKRDKPRQAHHRLFLSGVLLGGGSSRKQHTAGTHIPSRGDAFCPMDHCLRIPSECPDTGLELGGSSAVDKGRAASWREEGFRMGLGG